MRFGSTVPGRIKSTYTGPLIELKSVSDWAVYLVYRGVAFEQSFGRFTGGSFAKYRDTAFSAATAAPLLSLGASRRTIAAVRDAACTGVRVGTSACPNVGDLALTSATERVARGSGSQSRRAMLRSQECQPSTVAMNLVLHGLLLQVIVSIVQFQYGFRLCSAGEPGYLDFDNLPETNFSCQGKVIGGYYADVEAGCQMFHVCTIGQKDEIMDIKFLCLNGTVFDQETRVCERVDEVDCSKSERFYNLNLELYGNNAVTLSLHDSGTEDENDSSELVEDHESHRTTSSRPSTTSSTTTTTPRPSISSTTSSSGSYQHSNGYPQHYQPQPRFPSVQTSQSKSLYDDKNGGYHHQYIYHTGDHRNNNVDINNDGNNNNNNQNDNNNNNNQATSYQLFNNQGVSSTTGAPQIRYSSTPSTQIQIHNDHQPTISPIFHATSSTIQTLLNSNANSPALINPIFHNHGIASTTEQFMVHNNNPRETAEYRDEVEGDERAEEDRRPLEAIQPTTQGKVSKLTISPPQEEIDRSGQQGKGSQLSSQQQQQQRATTNFLPTPASESGQAVRSFYPTPRTSTKSSSSHITHIHLPPPPTIPQLKPHQVTINLSPPDIQRIVQNPSPLLPSQSRVIVTAKASVSDESGRPLNSTQLVTLPIPTIPASYDDYKEGDESFDPFYRDVPKVRTNRRTGGHIRWSGAESRQKRSQRVRRDVDDVKIDEEKAAESSDDAGEEPKQKAAEVEASEKGEDDAESQNLKTESETGDTRNHTKTVPEDKVNEKIVIDTKESDEPEYVNSDDAVSKTAVHGGDTDDQELTDAKDDAFDSKIFDEPESQTSKEVDVRAIAQSDAKYAKDRSHRLDKEDKNSKSDNSNSLGTSKRHHEEKSSRFSLALPEVVDSESSAKHSTKKAQLEAEISEKDEETLEEEMGEEISEENLPEDDYYYDEEMDDASLKSNEGDSVEHSKEAPSKVDPSPKSNSARHSKSSKTDDATEEYYDVANDSTTQSNEQAGSDDLSDEYVDSQADASPDDSREVQDDEGESPVTEAAATQEPIDDVTSTTEQQIELSESTTMKQDKHSQNHEKHLSEGVLKFTDEIPKQEKTDEPAVTEKPEFVEETPQDYIDDNYEPQSYKEQKVSSSTVETITTEKIVEDATVQAADYDKDANESSTTVKSALDAVDDKEDKQNDQAPPESKVVETPLEKSIEKSLESEKEASTTISTTASTSTTTTPTAAVSTTTPATATTVTATAPPTEMTTTAPTTIPTTTTRSTTARPTPPKLFKPFTMRKSYVYVPPTTTPIPVIIKPRLPLLNPKPAKPPKSYNDLAPKPIIRKSPLYARKAYSTTRTTTPRELKAPEDSTEVPAETTENPTVEKITPSPSSTTTEASTTRITETSSPAATNSPSTKTDEISKITDNHVPISISQSFEASSTTESQTFTPYPMLRITEATTALEEDIGEASKPLHVDRSTTYRSYVESNDVPSATGSGTSSKIPEIITIVTPVPYSSSTPLSSSTQEPWHSELPLIEPTSDSSMLQNNVATNKPEFDIAHSTSVGPPSSDDTITTNEAINVAPTLASVKAVNRRPVAVKRTAFFNCLEKEMYRFYADGRDCRLFHYCSPGFTSRQVLDFRFVCEEGTAFDEETQSCIHDVKSPKCRKRVW